MIAGIAAISAPAAFSRREESIQVFGQADAIVGLDIVKYARRLRIGDDDVEREPQLLALPRQPLVVVNGGTDTESADEA